MIRWKL